MTIALDSEIVGTSFDAQNRLCSYTIQRNGKRWTVQVPLAHLEAHKGNKQNRRNHLGKLLEGAMNGPHDPASGTKDDPFKPQLAQDFAALRSGAWYVNPADGRLYQKP